MDYSQFFLFLYSQNILILLPISYSFFLNYYSHSILIARSTVILQIVEYSLLMMVQKDCESIENTPSAAADGGWTVWRF